MSISVESMCKYLHEYIWSYQRDYKRFTTPTPRGSGYPRISVSPYLTEDRLTCWLLRDGILLFDMSWEPSYAWHISGGPAIIVSRPGTNGAPEMMLPWWHSRVTGERIGTYLISAKEQIPDDVWAGEMPASLEGLGFDFDKKQVHVLEFDIALDDALARLTYGASKVVTIGSFPEDPPFWKPIIMRDVGFAANDNSNRRFIHYLEIYARREESEWDRRAIWARVGADIRRHFASSIFDSGLGGTIEYPTNTGQLDRELNRTDDRLQLWAQQIDEFGQLLNSPTDKVEAVFHDFLEARPALLDLYGQVESKPKFVYPAGQSSPIGKSWVEPDFIVIYPNRTYRLIEIERPGKLLSTRQGQPRAEFTQAEFQTREWRDYIANFPHLLQDRFPGISAYTCTTALIISRGSVNIPGGGDVRRYLQLCKVNSGADEIMVYDDLLDKARHSYAQISAISGEFETRGSLDVSEHHHSGVMVLSAGKVIDADLLRSWLASPGSFFSSLQAEQERNARLSQAVVDAHEPEPGDEDGAEE